MRCLILVAAWFGFFLVPAVADPQGTTGMTNRVEMMVRDGYRHIYANGIPDHSHGEFPNRKNPNTIREQRYSFRVPLNPSPAKEPLAVGLMPFGVALNGVPFDPGAAEFWNNDRSSGWQYEALSGKMDLGMDHNNAHVQPTGAYHYHGLPQVLVARKQDSDGKMVLLGYAADGFPIYAPFGYEEPSNSKSSLRKLKSSYQLKKGERPTGPKGTYDGTFVEDYEYVPGSGDLDECNGRLGVTPEYPDGIYHYYLTETFPFISRFFRGIPDESFKRRGPPGGFGQGGIRPQQRPAGGGPPPRDGQQRRERRPPPPR